MTGDKPLLAYAVHEETEGFGCVVFARHPVSARRLGAGQVNHGEFAGLSCRRAPEFDRYAPGPVPLLTLVDAGWWFACAGCERRIDSDLEDEDDGTALDPVEVKGALWCTAACRYQFLAERGERKIAELAEVERLRDRLWTRCPGVTLTGVDHVHVRKEAGVWRPLDVRIGFTFPGAVDGGDYRLERGNAPPEVWVSRRDEAAWHAWRGRVEGRQ